jgi:hypothetical protein
MEPTNLKPAMSMYASKKEFEAAMEAWLESEDDDFYDAEGNSTPGGLYDAGGHPIAERFADYIDQINDEFKYRDL